MPLFNVHYKFKQLAPIIKVNSWDIVKGGTMTVESPDAGLAEDQVLFDLYHHNRVDGFEPIITGTCLLLD